MERGIEGYLVATVAVFIAYLIAVSARGWSWNILAITRGVHSRASLSKLQLFFFTLVVIWAVVALLVWTGKLTDLSENILILLGIGAVGTVGGKVTAIAKKRLSSENLAWIKLKKWIDESIERESKDRNPQFMDLLRSEGEFDITKFQLLVFSLIVGAALIYAVAIGEVTLAKSAKAVADAAKDVGEAAKVVAATGSAAGDAVKAIGDAVKAVGGAAKVVAAAAKAGAAETVNLAKFTVPEAYLGLIGLSQVVYIGGKAAAPSIKDELDKKLNEIRDLEAKFVAAVATAWADPSWSGGTEFADARIASTDTYQAYMLKANEAAEMVRERTGNTITPKKIEPRLPVT